MTQEILQYKNELTEYYFGDLTATELNIISTILYKLKNQDTLEVSFELDELKKLIQYKSKKEDFKMFAFNTFTRLQDFKIFKRDPKKPTDLVSFVVLPMLRLSTDTGRITVQANEFLAQFLNNLSQEYTKIFLNDLNSLSSTYSKRLYQLLMRFKSTGKAYFNFEEFRFLMGVPKTYLLGNIDQKVLKPAIDELLGKKKIPALLKTITYSKHKTGRKVTGINFKFKLLDERLSSTHIEPIAQPQQTGNFVPLNPKIVNKKPNLKAQGSK